MNVPASVIGRVFRCAWCHKAEPVPGGLLFFTYTADDGTGHLKAAAADAAGWSRSDGICPAHLATAR